MAEHEPPFLARLAGRLLRVMIATGRRRPRLQMLLGSWGCEVVLVSTPRQVVERHRAAPADLVVVDLSAVPRRKVSFVLSNVPLRPRLVALVQGEDEAVAARRNGYDEAFFEPLSLVELEGFLLALAIEVSERRLPTAG